MKKILSLTSLILLLVGCANSKPINFKTTSLEGKKSVLTEEIVEETSDSILGEQVKKVVKRVPTTSSAIVLTEQNSFEDENFALNFKFNSNNIDITIKNKTNTDASFSTDYSYFLSLDDKKYRLVLLESWKGSTKSIKSQQSPVILKSSTTTINVTPELCIDSSSGTGAENYQYWQTGSLVSTTIGRKAVKDYVEILLPIKLNSTIYTYLFKLKLSK